MMKQAEREIALELVRQACDPEYGRYTSDLPITAEVWLSYTEGHNFTRPRALLLTPHADSDIGKLRIAVLSALDILPASPNRRISTEKHRERYLASSESHLLANITLDDVLRLLPLTRWWRETVLASFTPDDKQSANVALRFTSPGLVKMLGLQVLDHVYSAEVLPDFHKIGPTIAGEYFFSAAPKQQQALARILNIAALQVALSLLGAPDIYQRQGAVLRATAVSRRMLRVFAQAFRPRELQKRSAVDAAPLWQVAQNRLAQHAMYESRKTVKVDAASRLFDAGGAGIRWAVIDGGIDARHPGFIAGANPVFELDGEQGRADRSRVVKTLDFTRLAAITSGDLSPELLDALKHAHPEKDVNTMLEEIGRGLNAGRMLDWSLLEPLLEISHAPRAYLPPQGKHGTHVAGIIGASWRSEDYLKRGVAPPIELSDSENVCGMCPEIELLDLRVFNENKTGDEFSIIGALQYVRYLNQNKDVQYVHGINLSLSLRHDVRTYACGSTPVCLECDRLSGNGVVVVAAAGNYGYDDVYAVSQLGGAYRGQSITDPGNAASVITVGATHRVNPYQYGVSYFSSRGPTGDGRAKPDLVAPGEKIMSLLPDQAFGSLDGTSMAAPHVSGVAALLLSRNKELMGHPARIKDILCKSASDLGRERAFQGAGLVDALRALQFI